MSKVAATESRLREAWDLTIDAWQRFWRTMKNTPGLLVLSVVLGISFWIFITEEENPTRVDELGTAVLIQSFNVEPGLAVANQLPTVELTLAAPEERWDEIASGQGLFTAFVDLNGMTDREQNVPVRIEIEGIQGVRVVEVNPESVVVNLEDMISVEVPVRVRPAGTMPIGYELDSTKTETPVVSVRGPESLVMRVSDAVADINITGLTLGVEQTVTLIPRGAGGGEIRGVYIDPPSQRVTVDIRQSTLVRSLPFRISVEGVPAPGYRVVNVVASPSTIVVEGSLQALQQIDSLELDPVDISEELSQVQRVVGVALPSGLTTEDSLVVTVIIQIAPIESELTLLVIPEVIGLADGLTAQLESELVEVTVGGVLPLLNQITTRELKVSLDATGLGPGVHEIAVDTILSEGLVRRALQPEAMSVTLILE